MREHSYHKHLPKLTDNTQSLLKGFEIFIDVQLICKSKPETFNFQQVLAKKDLPSWAGVRVPSSGGFRQLLERDAVGQGAVPVSELLPSAAPLAAVTLKRLRHEQLAEVLRRELLHVLAVGVDLSCGR